MAKRPIFIESDEPPFVKEIFIEFEWYSGFSIIQAQRSIRSLHLEAAKRGFTKLLEISTKSPDVFGEKLSAFRIFLQVTNGIPISVECAFQGSKIFKHGGPYQELYYQSSREAKKDKRLKESGELTGFRFYNTVFPAEPKTAFYDWLYIQALDQNVDLAEKLMDFEGFTDIAFNPQKSLNCQARSAAMFVALKRTGKLELALESKEAFLATIFGKNQTMEKNHPTQNLLFP